MKLINYAVVLTIVSLTASTQAMQDVDVVVKKGESKVVSPGLKGLIEEFGREAVSPTKDKVRRRRPEVKEEQEEEQLSPRDIKKKHVVSQAQNELRRRQPVKKEREKEQEEELPLAPVRKKHAPCDKEMIKKGCSRGLQQLVALKNWLIDYCCKGKKKLKVDDDLYDEDRSPQGDELSQEEFSDEDASMLTLRNYVGRETSSAEQEKRKQEELLRLQQELRQRQTQELLARQARELLARQTQVALREQERLRVEELLTVKHKTVKHKKELFNYN